MHTLKKSAMMNRHVSVRKLRQWRMLSDGGKTLYDTILAKLFETPHTFTYLNTIIIPREQNNGINFTMKGLLHIRRDESRRIQVTRRATQTSYTAELDIPEIAIEFKFPITFGFFHFNVIGKIDIEKIKVFMELSEKNGKIMLVFVKLVSIHEIRTVYNDEHHNLRRLFRRRVQAKMQEIDIIITRTVNSYLGKAINRILATDELFQ